MDPLVKSIKESEKLAAPLEPVPEMRTDWNRLTSKYADRFLNSLDTLPAYRETTHRGSALRDRPFAEQGMPLAEILELFRVSVEEPGLNPASGGHLGYIPGGGIYSAALGDYLAGVTNRYSGVFFASPGAVRMENLLIDWMIRLAGLPESAFGTLTSGGSIANLTAIVTARDACRLEPADFQNTVAYMTEQAHHSINKALRIAGLGSVLIRKIPTDKRFRLNPHMLARAISDDRRKALNPWMVIASAGTTDTGSIDPLAEIAAITRREKLWLHVDAAYGGFFLLTELCRRSLKGLQHADSLVMDPHKGLFLPYGLGAVLVKDHRHLFHSHQYLANYMQDTLENRDEISPADISPELSRHFRGLRLWLPLLLHGIGPFRAALTEKILLAQYAYRQLAAMPGFETGAPPDLSVVTFRYLPQSGDPDAFNEALVNEIRRDGRIFLSSTRLNGRFIIRLAILAFRTHLSTIDLFLKVLRETVDRLSKNGSGP